MGQNEAINYLMSQCVWDNNTEENALKHWVAARDRLRPVPWKPGYPEILDIPNEYHGYLERVIRYPMFQAVLEGLSYSFKLVEIDPILSFQYHVVHDIGEVASSAYRVESSLERVLEAALPLTPPKQEVAVTQEFNAVTISAPTLNLRLLGPVRGEQDGAQLSGFAWSFGFPFIIVVRYEGRCYLKNGYHRTVAFRRLGLTHIPCLFLEGFDYSHTGAARPGFFPKQVMLSDSAPTVGHFAEDIAYPVQLRSLMKVIRISATEMVIPMDI